MKSSKMRHPPGQISIRIAPRFFDPRIERFIRLVGVPRSAFPTRILEPCCLPIPQVHQETIERIERSAADRAILHADSDIETVVENQELECCASGIGWRSRRRRFVFPSAAGQAGILAVHHIDRLRLRPCSFVHHPIERNR